MESPNITICKVTEFLKDKINDENIKVVLDWSKSHPWQTVCYAIFVSLLVGPILLLLGLFVSFSCCLILSVIFTEVLSISFGLMVLLPFGGFAASTALCITAITACGYSLSVGISRYLNEITESKYMKKNPEDASTDVVEDVSHSDGFDFISNEAADPQLGASNESQ